MNQLLLSSWRWKSLKNMSKTSTFDSKSVFSTLISIYSLGKKLKQIQKYRIVRQGSDELTIFDLFDRVPLWNKISILWIELSSAKYCKKNHIISTLNILIITFFLSYYFTNNKYGRSYLIKPEVVLSVPIQGSNSPKKCLLGLTLPAYNQAKWQKAKFPCLF